MCHHPEPEVSHALSVLIHVHMMQVGMVVCVILCPHREAYQDIVVVALDANGQQRSSSFQVSPEVIETTDEAAISPCEPPMPGETHSCSHVHA